MYWVSCVMFEAHAYTVLLHKTIEWKYFFLVTDSFGRPDRRIPSHICKTIVKLLRVCILVGCACLCSSLCVCVCYRGFACAIGNCDQSRMVRSICLIWNLIIFSARKNVFKNIPEYFNFAWQQLFEIMSASAYRERYLFVCCSHLMLLFT